MEWLVGSVKSTADKLIDTLEVELNKIFKKLFGRSQVALVEGALGDVDKIVDISALKSKVDNVFDDVSTRIKKIIGEGAVNITAGKNFKDHFIRHKNILENALGTKYPKFKTHG